MVALPGLGSYTQFVMMHVLRMILIVIGAVTLTLMIFENSLIFHPDGAHRATPTAHGLPFEDVRFRARDGVGLHGWFVTRRPARATVLFFHGNAGNISHRLNKARRLHAIGLQVFLVDYRGYGLSEGHVTEQGTYRDALAAWKWLRARPDVDGGRIVCFGESLGGAVAIDLAARVPCRALILESTFTSMADLAEDIFFTPMRWLVATRYQSERKLRAIRAPVLVIHGTEDRLVPFAHARRLLAAAAGPTTLFAIPRAGHNDAFVVAGKQWEGRIGAFLRDVLGEARSAL